MQPTKKVLRRDHEKKHQQQSIINNANAVVNPFSEKRSRFVPNVHNNTRPAMINVTSKRHHQAVLGAYTFLLRVWIQERRAEDPPIVYIQAHCCLTYYAMVVIPNNRREESL